MVAVLLRNDPVYVDVVHACRIGGIYYCPINWHFTAEEVRFLLADSGARALIVHAGLLAEVRDAVPAGTTVLEVADGCAAAGGNDYEAWLANQSPYDGPRVSPRGHMAYTSGTTGRPKGVLREPVPLDQLDEQIARSRSLVRQTYGIVPGCRTLMSHRCTTARPGRHPERAADGRALVLTPRFDAEQVLALVEKHRIDVLYLVPIMYVRLLKLPPEVRARYDLSSIRFVASTGSPCAPEVKRAMLEWLGPVIHETYASSEAGMITVLRPPTPRRAPARPASRWMTRSFASSMKRAGRARGRDRPGLCAPARLPGLHLPQQ